MERMEIVMMKGDGGGSGAQPMMVCSLRLLLRWGVAGDGSWSEGEEKEKKKRKKVKGKNIYIINKNKIK